MATVELLEETEELLREPDTAPKWDQRRADAAGRFSITTPKAFPWKTVRFGCLTFSSDSPRISLPGAVRGPSRPDIVPCCRPKPSLPDDRALNCR